MLHRYLTAVLFVFGSILLTVSTLHGQESSTPALTGMFSHRFRLVHWDDGLIIQAPPVPMGPFTFTRHLTRAGLRWQPAPSVQIEAALANEFRYFFEPDVSFTLNEIFFDALSIRWSNIFSQPVQVTAGRQDMHFGEGFIVMDGTPLDGSRSGYFNALRTDLDLDETRMTAFYAFQQDFDSFLPLINPRDQRLLEQPTHAYGVHGKSSVGTGSLEYYGIGRVAIANALVPVDAHTVVLGSRIAQPLGAGWDITAEGGYQLGSVSDAWSDQRRSAWGGYTYLGWERPGGALRLDGGAILLSGDDPSTPVRSDWDPMFARWPKWSDSWIYAVGWEDGVASWTNLVSVFLRANVSLGDAGTLFLQYHHLDAQQPAPDVSDRPFGPGMHRGDLLTARVSMKFGAGFSGHALWESFFRGRYYAPGSDTRNSSFWRYDWMRLELRYDLAESLLP